VRAGDRHLNFYETRDNLTSSACSGLQAALERKLRSQESMMIMSHHKRRTSLVASRRLSPDAMAADLN
jgi:hypothetical protein